MRLAVLNSALICLLTATLAAGREVTLQVDPPICLPIRGNAALTAKLLTDGPTEEVDGLRLYFRRLHPLGSFYYVEMKLLGDHVFSAILPKAEDRAPAAVSEAWWNALSRRAWLRGNDRAWLVGWLADLEFEPVEYFVSAHDDAGARLTQTPIAILEVEHPSRCPVVLDPRELQWAQAISLGETMDLQTGRPPFHWSCDGVVDRISPDGTRSPDRSCAH